MPAFPPIPFIWLIAHAFFRESAMWQMINLRFELTRIPPHAPALHAGVEFTDKFRGNETYKAGAAKKIATLPPCPQGINKALAPKDRSRTRWRRT
jgi:hypothetical protein